jgi:hypothetical protein
MEGPRPRGSLICCRVRCCRWTFSFFAVSRGEVRDGGDAILPWWTDRVRAVPDSLPRLVVPFDRFPFCGVARGS